MPGLLQWLDYSEHDRRKALDVIALFHEQDTRDELGLGAVRDGFADLFFPGTSTIQTRARYFLFIPWVYLDLERRGLPWHADMAGRARAAEIRLIDALATSEAPSRHDRHRRARFAEATPQQRLLGKGWAIGGFACSEALRSSISGRLTSSTRDASGHHGPTMMSPWTARSCATGMRDFPIPLTTSPGRLRFASDAGRPTTSRSAC